MTQAAWLLPALPAGAALVGFFVGHRPRLAASVAVLGAAAALAAAIGIVAAVERDPGRLHENAHRWVAGVLNLSVGTELTQLAAIVAVMVAVVALAVQVYSIEYMRGDPRYQTYAAEISLFTAAMLLVVVASDLFELLVGWEVMGLCSYLLIGHYWQTEGARSAAVKAFVVTRIGDVGFLFGIFALGLGAHSFSIDRVLSVHLSHPTATAGALLLLCGVVGKSAQFPLHVWLPDAMAGPTPVSALIHAATMVAAGIFVVARLYPVFVAAPVSLTVLGIVACITMLGAALCALGEDDLKRVLAWSTVSQLAYMAAGLAVGGWTASVYHLISHAAFKALLFLAAGSVLRTVGSNDMGGLWRRMPVTFVTTVVGAAALAGLPPLAGAFSKDGILDAARAKGGGLGTAVYVVGLVTVFVTATYATRLVVRTFLGSYRGQAHLHESPRLMTVPLVLLAVATVGLGAPVLPASYGVPRWLGHAAGARDLHVTTAGVVTTTVLALAAVAVVAALHRRRPDADPLAVLGGLMTPLRRAFWVDDLYDVAIVRPVLRVVRGVLITDRRGVDGTAVGVGRAVSLLGAGVRRLQNGNVQAYVSGLVVAVLVIIVSVSASAGR